MPIWVSDFQTPWIGGNGGKRPAPWPEKHTLSVREKGRTRQWELCIRREGGK